VRRFSDRGYVADVSLSVFGVFGWIWLDAFLGNDMKPGFGLVEFARCLVIPLGE